MPSPTQLRPDPAQRPPESDADARARHLDMLREIAELGMRAARIATDRIEANAAGPEEAPEPSVTLARGTQAALQAMALEQRIRTGSSAAPPRPATSSDPRRTLLRSALHHAAKAEPDRAIRTRTCRFIDERLDADLAADPEAKIPIGKILLSIARELGLVIDVAQLPDELLGPARPHRYPPPGADHGAHQGAYQEADRPNPDPRPIPSPAGGRGSG